MEGQYAVERIKEALRKRGHTGTVRILSQTASPDLYSNGKIPITLCFAIRGRVLVDVKVFWDIVPDTTKYEARLRIKDMPPIDRWYYTVCQNSEDADLLRRAVRWDMGLDGRRKNGGARKKREKESVDDKTLSETLAVINDLTQRCDKVLEKCQTLMMGLAARVTHLEVQLKAMKKERVR